ncbi:MAG: hypothetical protein AABX51_01535, partial [Nanoarchaeota archaeon]
MSGRIRKQMLIPFGIILLAILQLSIANSDLLVLEKSVYQLGEPVYFIINSNLSDVSLFLKINNQLYKFIEPGNVTVFTPSAEGNYTLELLSDNSVLETKEFIVAKFQEKKQNSGIFIASPKYLKDETVQITVTTDIPKDLLIKSLEKTYKYFDVGSEIIPFHPHETGQHAVELWAKNGGIEDTKYFEVEESRQIPIQNDEVKGITLKDHRSNKRSATLKILPSDNLSANSDVELALNGESVRKIKFTNFNLRNSGELGIDEVPAVKVNIGKKTAIKAFAIDPSQLNFSNATFTSIASGKELYKCAEWNFAQQTCDGSWNKIMDLQPGVEYSVQFNSSDPAYAETGVASINSKKSIYKPGETAELIIVVLDTSGHLVSEANVAATITSPSNQVSQISGIQETGRGIYEFSFANTLEEGNYSMVVSAIGPSVNSSMISYFTVLSSYPFDILRNTPVTTDPWKGAFSSSVHIISFTGTTSFSFTERLPSNFTVTYAGGAIVSSSVSGITLTWQGLSNESIVTYSAIPPMITPNLYEIGPGRIDYPTGSFDEARVWYLAVDPAFIENRVNATLGTSGHVNSNNCGAAGASNVLFSSGSSVIVGNDATGNGREFQLYLDFNTSNLPDDAVVSQASLYVRLVSETGEAGDTIEAYSCNYGTTLTNGDFGTTLGTDQGIFFTGSSSSGQFQSLRLTSLSTSINASGNSQFCFRIIGGCVDTDDQFVVYDGATANVPYLLINYTTPPNVSLNLPALIYTNSTLPPITINFSCSITDDLNSTNLSLYITNSTNASIAYRNSCLIPSGANSTCSWLVNLSNGNYTWSCLGYDSYNLTDWADINRSIVINWTRSPPNVSLIIPAAGYSSAISPTQLNFTCSITDEMNATNVSLYITNSNNASFAFNNTCLNPSGFNTNCSWLINVTDGNYTWNCLGFNNKSLSDWGDLNRSLAINSVSAPPSISFVNCSIDGGSYGSCTNAVYGRTITTVRAGCNSTGGGQVNNVTFTLTNLNDNTVYFNSTVLSPTGGGYWEYNASARINDSGEFNLSTTCRQNPTAENGTNWSVAWGNLSMGWFSPLANVNVSRNLFSSYTLVVNCSGGECGWVNATLDPSVSGYLNATNETHLIVPTEVWTQDGSFSDTFTNNGTASGIAGYYVFGIDSGVTETPHNITLEFVYNLSSRGFTGSRITSANFATELYLTGGGLVGPENDAAETMTISNSYVQFWNGSSWISVGNPFINSTSTFETGNGTFWDETTDANGERPINKTLSANFSDSFVNSSGLFRVRLFFQNVVMDGSTNSDDVIFNFDYAWLSVVYDKGVIPMGSGMPFYTVNQNPSWFLNTSCLGSMQANNSCNVTW